MKKKLIISSLSAIVACASVVAGATYALFTSESKVNVAVTSGTVEVVATAKNFVLSSGVWNSETSSYDIVPTGTDYFANGGTVDYSDGHSVKMERLTAMDYVTFDIDIENRSDINIKYQTVLSLNADEGLFEELEVTTSIDETTSEFTGKKVVSSWVTLEPGADISTISVTLGLPEESNAQGLSCELEYAVYAVQANAHTVEYWDGSADTSWYNETDTEFNLNTPSQLAGLSTLVNEGNTFIGKTLNLTGNIDLGNVSWTPIGTDANGFMGTFDGGNYTISNFTVETKQTAGLFGYALNGGNVKNLRVENAYISAHDYAGAIMGRGYTDIDNCHVKNVTVVTKPYLTAEGIYDGGAKAGGVIGQMLEGSGNTVTNCSATDVKIYAFRDLGGVVGMVHNNNSASGNTASNVTLGYILNEEITADKNGNAGAIYGRVQSSADVSPKQDSAENQAYTLVEVTADEV